MSAAIDATHASKCYDNLPPAQNCVLMVVRDYTLNKARRNELYELIEASGMKASDFELVVEEMEVDYYPTGFFFSLLFSGREKHAERYSKIVHRPTGFYYLIRKSCVDCLPGLDERTSESVRLPDHVEVHEGGWGGRVYRDGWDNVNRQVFSGWLCRVESDSKTPDLWSLLVSSPPSSPDPLLSEDNRPFGDDEKVQIERALTDIGSYINSTGRFSEGLMEEIRLRLSHLESAASRLGRKDWLGIFVSQLISIGVAAALNSEELKALISMAAEAIRPVFGVATRLLGQ